MKKSFFLNFANYTITQFPNKLFSIKIFLWRREIFFLTQRLYRRANGHRLMFWNAYNFNFTFRYFVGGSLFCMLNIQNSYTVVPEHRHVIGLIYRCCGLAPKKRMAKRLTIFSMWILVAKKISACALHVRIGMRGLNGIVSEGWGFFRFWFMFANVCIFML